MVSFLDLPQDTRYRVYAQSKLVVRSCPIEINRPYVYDDPESSPPICLSLAGGGCLYTARKNGGDKSLSRNSLDCTCSKPPVRLFLICRTVYRESFYVFFSLNKFVIRVHDAYQLRKLSLTNDMLGTITSLTIRLNSWPCPRGHEATRLDGFECRTCHTPVSESDPPLDVTSRAGQDLLSEWQRFAYRLKYAILPRTLALTFICDVKDTSSGLAILDPILRLPLLKECTIRIGRRFDHELFDLAQSTALLATGQYTGLRGTFPFQSLPKEIRLRILGYTHLGFNDSYRDIDYHIPIRENKLAQSNAHYMRPHRSCCQKCTATLIDCCCTPTCSAYSPNCDCRQIPFELFHVSKDMRADSIETLFSQNCLDFLQDPAKTIVFLKNLPRGTLGFIRRLEFRFSEAELLDWRLTEYSHNLKDLALFLKKVMRVSRLSVSVVVDSYDICVFEEEDEDTRFIYDIYCDITEAFRVLSDLEDFQVKLGFFIDLEPVMMRAILGSQHPKVLAYSLDPTGTDRATKQRTRAFGPPPWYHESHFSGSVWRTERYDNAGRT